MIVLPLHGQNTAAVELFTGQAVPLICRGSRGDVFGKQAGLVLPSSFLLFLL